MIGAPSTYTIEVNNVGDAPTAGPVTVTDTLDPGLDVGALNADGWNCSVPPSLVCTRTDPLAPGASYPPITIEVTPKLGTAVLSNTATVAASPDGDASNNSFTDTAAAQLAVVDLVDVPPDTPQPQPQPQPQPAAPAAAAPPVAVESTCQSQRSFEIRLRERRGRVVRSASVLVAGKPVAIMRRRSDGRWAARVDLRGQPAGSYTVELRATLRGGRRLTWTRSYRTCTFKLAPSNRLSDPRAL